MILNPITILRKIGLAKLILFLSAYIPLFIIIGIKYFLKLIYYIHIPYLKLIIPIPIIPITILIVIIILIHYFKKIIDNSKSETEKFFEVNRIEDKNDIILTYLVPYFFSFVSVNSFEEFICCIVIFLIIFMIYINSEILYINPLFIFSGYNFYKIYSKNTNILLISQIDVNRRLNKKIGAKQLSTKVYMVSDDDE
ncbi:hypothetical protein [Methanobrevibacter thaueri]|uniref:Uncharacterized protein n=1 Tax=Methanobrevibacter thaueri TaxID=190975 RepID=A0A315XNU4_9EURY|nr:hypothetical protein [Methanobrevibacter thaueri]PWB88077.1 hypothetical protein MBBTH_02210 [Methanobrevibacter thaueri]